MPLAAPKPPGEPSLPWCAANRASLPAYLQVVRSLSSLQPIVTLGGVTRVSPVRWSGANAQIVLEGLSVPLDPETIIWRAGATAAGGTFAEDSVALADALIRAVKASSFNSKLVYLLPLLGGNLATALQPLRDTRAAGRPGNTAFVDGDFAQATGLQGDGTSKVLDSHLTPAALGTGSNGGLGFWEKNIAFTGVGALIAYSLQTAGSPVNYDYFYISAGASSSEFAWNINTGALFTTYGTASTNGHYYGQRASATSRTLYKDGASVATTSGSDSAPGATGGTFFIMGTNRVGAATGYHAGRCAVAYMTDGTLTAAEITALHTLLQTYLITPTGR